MAGGGGDSISEGIAALSRNVSSLERLCGRPLSR